MRLTADTNLLVRAAVRDDERQARAAAKALRGASVIAVPVPTLREFVWVLRKVYGLPQAEIAAASRALAAAANVAVDRPAVEAGLAARVL